jgi:hypothetical protein
MKKTLIAALLMLGATLPAAAQSVTGTLPFYVDATGGKTWKDVADVFAYALTDALPGSQNFAVTAAASSADAATRVMSAPATSLAIGLVKSDFISADARLPAAEQKFGKLNWVIALVAPIVTCVGPAAGANLDSAVIVAPPNGSVGYAMAKTIAGAHPGASISADTAMPKDLVGALNAGTVTVACGIPYAIVARNLKDKVSVVGAIGPQADLDALKLPNLAATVPEGDRDAFRAATASAAFYYALISSADPASEAGKALTDALAKLVGAKRFIAEVGQMTGRISPIDGKALTDLVNGLYAISPETFAKSGEIY